MNKVIEAIKKRSSTRSYTTEKLTEEELNALVTAGLEAPTARNEQEVHISVLDGTNPILAEIEEERRKLANIPANGNGSNFYYQAPTVMILSADESFHWGGLDSGICVENIALAAESMGLGTVIIGIIKDAMQGEKKEYFSKALKFPEGYGYTIAIAIGHKAASKEPHEIDMEKNVAYLN